MKLHLSNSDYLGNFAGFLRSFDSSDPSRLEITTHRKWINVHPAILTLVAALACQAGRENVSIDEVTATSGHYLDRMGLFDYVNNPSPFDIAYKEEAGRFIPLTRIKTAQEQSVFISDMIPLLHLPPDKADSIKYAVGELVRNVLEHADSDSGALVAAQYYQRSNMIRLGICDDGIGIKRSMDTAWNPKDDLNAIELALMPGVTGTTRREGGTEENAGAGLFFVKSLSMITRDYFMVYSGSAVYTLLKRRMSKKLPPLYADPRRDRHSSTNEAPLFSGTLVGIDISLDDTEEFDVMLSFIRQAYLSAIRERKQQRRRRPQFI